MRVPLAAFVCIACALAGSARAEVIRIAVVGFDSTEPADVMRALSGALREELAKQVEPGKFAVVTREEMASVYARNGGCVAPDTACIVDASGQWGGRLFVRGTTQRDASTGAVRLDVTLESVRGVLVAQTSARAPRAEMLKEGAAKIARDLVDGERSFRTSSTVAPHPTLEIGGAHPPGAGGKAANLPLLCNGTAVMGASYVTGALVSDDKALHFADDKGATQGAAVQWTALKELRSIDYNQQPAVHVLTSSSKDDILVTFANIDVRDECLMALRSKADTSKKKR
jgi:hypothetical protein